MTDISDWYKGIPRFTKYWLTLTVVISVLAQINVLPSYYLVLYWQWVWRHFQIWRMVTALFYYPTGFSFLINCFLLYQYSVRLEEYFRGSPSEYLFLLIFNWLCFVLIGIIASFSVLMDPMVLSVLYVWCQLNKEVVVNFWFGTRFKAVYLPWVLLIVHFVLNRGMDSVAGIVVGHLYHFLKYEYPQQGGTAFLETPAILKRYFPNVRGAHGFKVFIPENQNVLEISDSEISNAPNVNVAGQIEVGLFAQMDDVLVECFDTQN